MSNSPNNPMDTSGLGASPLSKTVYCIAGIRTTVYGIDQLPENVSEIACLWLLHPRLATDESMAPMAGKAISHWNNRRGSQKKGLIAVSFDQRNHGTRKIDPVANEAWRQGNPRHAQDMFSIYRTTTIYKDHPTLPLTLKKQKAQLKTRLCCSPIYQVISRKLSQLQHSTSS
jgi:hypothetical protein